MRATAKLDQARQVGIAQTSAVLDVEVLAHGDVQVAVASMCQIGILRRQVVGMEPDVALAQMDGVQHTMGTQMVEHTLARLDVEEEHLEFLECAFHVCAQVVQQGDVDFGLLLLLIRWWCHIHWFTIIHL